MYKPGITFVLLVIADLLAGLRLLAEPVDLETSRPNIVFLLADDQRAGTLGVEGHAYIKTPHLDRLADEGIRFAEAHVVNPICMPSRTTFLNGRYERVHGQGFASTNSMSDAQWEETFPARLRKSGYHTGFVGKFGLERYVFRGNVESKFDSWRGHDGWASFFPKEQSNGAIYREAEADINTAVMSEYVGAFIDEAPGDKPFCLCVSFSAPHGSVSGTMFPGEGGSTRMTHAANENPRLKDHPLYGSLYRDLGIEIPRETAADPGRFIPADVLPQKGRIGVYTYNYKKPTNLEHHIRYAQLITGVDKAVGDLRGKLAEHGLADNTVIIYTSDHGLLMGEYGMGGKSLLYDLCTRVPFLYYDPRLPDGSRSSVRKEMVLNTDLAPTIMELAGLDVPGNMPGQSLLGLLGEARVTWRQEIFTENLWVGRGNPISEAVRTPGWKYIRYFPSPGDLYTDADVDLRGREPVFEQLFSLHDDPAELVNLVKNPAYTPTLETMRQRCKKKSAGLIEDRAKYRAALDPSSASQNGRNVAE